MVAARAVTLLIVIVPLEPAAVMEPGNAVAPVSAAHEADETDWVALTAPEPVVVQVVLSAPFILMVTLVAPEATVLKTSRKLVPTPCAIRFNLIYELVKVAAEAGWRIGAKFAASNKRAATTREILRIFNFFTMQGYRFFRLFLRLA